MKKLFCDKTRTVWVEDGMQKQDSEGELYREIPCSSITKVSRSHHLLMLGLCQASKLVKWFPVPLRVFADGQERDGFVESVRNPQVQTRWNTSVTEMGIRQNISGEKSFMIPWKNLVCMVETDMDLIFFQKDKWHYCMVPKEGLESPGQMESLKELCREKNMEVLAGKRKKYVPNWFFPLLTVVIAGYVAIYVWM